LLALSQIRIQSNWIGFLKGRIRIRSKWYGYANTAQRTYTGTLNAPTSRFFAEQCHKMGIS
jgi:hypothetical protein